MALVSLGWLTLALPALSFLFYCGVAGGMLLAWRFHSSRIFFSLAVLFLAQQAVAISAGNSPYIPATLHPGAGLGPPHFGLIAITREGGVTPEVVVAVG